MTLDTYTVAGMKHTSKDTEVNLGMVKENQSKLNGHVSMWIKVFRIGKSWRHEDRIRETMLNNSLAVCPLYLLFKDHKGWFWQMGGAPPTRPVASGNAGMNLHLSEMISKLLEPIANNFDGGLETISGEDMLSKIDQLNDKNKDWQKTKNGGGEGSQQEEQICPGVDYAGGCGSDTPPPLCTCANHKPSCD